jgi:thiol-disulfide isomerase/thioredoxin
MKKRYSILVMAALCLFLSKTKAQSKANQSVQIGQKIPEVTLTNIHNYKTSKLNLADLETKLIIIDFWATWCSPCIAMIPKMDSLQKEFAHDLQIITVSYQDKNEVLPFMDKMEKQKGIHYQIPIVTNDQLLAKLFPHRTLPHYVWIGGDGTVKAITGAEEITSANIEKMLNGEPLSLPVKKDITRSYDDNTPFLVNGNGGDGKELIYHSIFSSYIEGLPGRFFLERADKKQVNRLTFTNCPVIWLYKHAYGDGYTTYFQSNRVIIEVSRPEELNSELTGSAYVDWLRKPGHGVCYELRLPVELADKFYPVMRNNLELLFPQYTATIERRKVKCMALVCLPGADRIKTLHPEGQVVEKFGPFGLTMQNSTIEAFLGRIQLQYQQTSKIPFINETGYEGRIDLTIQANLSNVADMNRALKPYNLSWQEKLVEQDMLVIRDRVKDINELRSK